MNLIFQNKFFDHDIERDSEEISYYRNMARFSNNTEYFVILGNLYLLGDAKSGVEPSKKYLLRFRPTNEQYLL